MKNCSDVRTQIKNVIEQMQAKSIDPKIATAMMYGLNAITKSYAAEHRHRVSVQKGEVTAIALFSEVIESPETQAIEAGSSNRPLVAKISE